MTVDQQSADVSFTCLAGVISDCDSAARQLQPQDQNPRPVYVATMSTARAEDTTFLAGWINWLEVAAAHQILRPSGLKFLNLQIVSIWLVAHVDAGQRRRAVPHE